MATIMNETSVWLDYGSASKKPALLRNLSAIAKAGDFLWTASDEGRTIECLEPSAGGYRLRRQYQLDALFPELPGGKNDEADIESLEAAQGRLWICGSHGRVRRKPGSPGLINAQIRYRPSRNLLGAIALTDDGGALKGAGQAMPFFGRGSLRVSLRGNPYLQPFIDLPSKENGLDVEGLLVRGRRAYVGLRGPLVESIALVAELSIADRPAINMDMQAMHLVDLGGLGVRDLAHLGSDIGVLAGPMSSAPGPFRIFRWRPRRTERVQKPKLTYEWPPITEHPEAMCLLEREGQSGLLTLYDAPDQRRIKGSRYRADWIPFSG